VRARLPLHDSEPVVPGLFSLTHVTNRGALFGLLHDLPDPWRAGLFTVVPFAAIVLILYFQGRTAPGDRLAHGGLALILGGPAGNLDLGIVGLLAGFVGAKLLLFALDARYYLADPMRMVQNLRSAGVYYGGLGLAVLASLWYVRRHRLPLGKVADLAAPALSL